MHQLVFRLLGPLDVRAGEQPVRFAGRRSLTVLAVLLLAADRVVSVDGLADAVWSDTPPTTARNQIAICVASLRKAFKEAGVDDVLRTSPPGYTLVRGEHRIDVLDFEEQARLAHDAARQGRAEDACRLLEEALGHWRGPALDGLGGERIAAEAARLEQLRLDLQEERAGLLLQLGRHRALVAELTALVEQNPLREQSRAHLMLALYRSGQRARALEVFRRGRDLLTEELGIEPGPVLQRLHDLVLQDSPELTLPPVMAPAQRPAYAAPRAAEAPPAPAQLPVATTSFTGRQNELAALGGLVRSPDGPAPLVATVTGMGGVGKTALAVHWAAGATADFPDGQLFADLRGYDAGHPPVPAAAVLDRFLRALGVPARQIPDDTDERAALYRTALSGRRTLVVLDNARDAAQVRPLLPGPGPSRVVITAREPLHDLTGELAGPRLRLGVLAPGEATALLTKIVGTERFGADPVAVQRLSALCDRLPLALRITGARLVARPHHALRDVAARLADERRRLDELSPGDSGVRAGFQLSYRELPPDAARLYRLLGLLRTPDFTAWTGAALLGTDPAEAEDLVEQLVDAQLLEVAEHPAPGSGRARRYRFQDLLRLYARERARAEEPAAECRAALERAFAGLLWLAEEARRRLDGADYPVDRARAEPAGLPRALADELLADPFGWFEAQRAAVVDTVAHAAEAGPADLAWRLAESAVPLFETHTYRDDWQRCAEQALAAARRAGDRSGEAAMLRQLGTLAIYLRRYETAEGWNTAALRLHRRGGHRQGTGLALRNLALCARFRGEWEQAARYGQESRAAFRELGDAGHEAQALGFLAQVELEHGTAGHAVALADEAVALSSRAPKSSRTAAQNVYWLGEALLRAGELDRAAHTFTDGLRLTRRDGNRFGEAYTLRGMGETLWRQERPDAAGPVLRDALELAREVGDRLLLARIETDLGCVDALAGRLPEAVERLERAAAGFGEVGAGLWRDRAEALRAALAGGGAALAGARPAPTVAELTRLLAA